MTVLLDIDRLSVDRGGVCILDEFSWQVRAGEHWALIGPNGCGKTALLNCILAYMDMGAGAVTLFGERYGEAEWQEVRKGVGLVSMGIARQLQPHERADHIVCTGYEGYLTCFTPPGSRRIKRARELLVSLGIGNVATRPWRVLSQGERSRVLIARALIADPKLLILDEPCTGLDPVARDHYLRDLDQLMNQDDAPVVIMVTHHIDEITPRFSHVLLMRQGTNLASGTKSRMLRSDMLSACFDESVIVRKRQGRHHLELS